MTSVPVALCHLLAGNMTSAIEQIARAAKFSNDVSRSRNRDMEMMNLLQSPSVLAITALAWEIIANHEDSQSRTILESAFAHLPMSPAQKNSSQLKNLWPNVRLLSWSCMERKQIESQSTASQPLSSLRSGTRLAANVI